MMRGKDTPHRRQALSATIKSLSCRLRVPFGNLLNFGGRLCPQADGKRLISAIHGFRFFGEGFFILKRS